MVHIPVWAAVVIGRCAVNTYKKHKQKEASAKFELEQAQRECKRLQAENRRRPDDDGQPARLVG
jgi:hypothetical protein